MEVPFDLKKALLDYSNPAKQRDLLKGAAGKRLDTGKLVLKDVVDTKGNTVKRWVDPSKGTPEPQTAKAASPKEDPKKKSEQPKQKPSQKQPSKSKMTEEEKTQKLEGKIQEIKKQYPNLSDESIKVRMQYQIPMDATEIKIYHDDPKYVCEFKDSRGRTQKRYTQDYSNKASQMKFERVKQVKNNIPDLRKQVEKDLSVEGMPKDKVCAMIVKLIDKCYFRIGNDKYTEQNGTYGVSTLMKDHLEIDGNELHFRYVGKKSVDQHQTTTDSAMSGLLQNLIDEAPGDRLFQYQDKRGNWRNISNNDVRDYLNKWNLNPKDFRTYHACRICSSKLAELGVTDDPKQIIKNVNEAVKFTAGFLGHTPEICRKSYISGEILKAYENGHVMGDWRESGVDAEFGEPNSNKLPLIKLSDLAYEKTVANGGVTIDLQGGSPAKGYAYAPRKDSETKIPEEEFSSKSIEEFVGKYKKELSETGNHLGIWVDAGFIYIDISKVGAPSKDTIKEAEAAGQLAVFDLESFETIYTSLGKAS